MPPDNDTTNPKGRSVDPGRPEAMRDTGHPPVLDPAVLKAIQDFRVSLPDAGLITAIREFQRVALPDPGLLNAIQEFQRTALLDPSLLNAIQDFQRAALPDAGVLNAIQQLQRTALPNPGLMKAMQGLLKPDAGLLRILHESAAAARDWDRVLRGMAARKEMEGEVLPRLAAYGWLISPSGPASQPAVLHSLFEQGGVAAVDAYLIDLLDTNACRKIVSDATQPKMPFSRRWTRTFDKAMAAMERGDHELSIPIWLAALESACLRTFKLKRVYNAQAETTRRRVAVHWARLSKSYEPLALAWTEVVIGVSGRPRGPAILNRHAVMHGDRPLIGSRKDAVQALLAMEVLGYLWKATTQNNSVSHRKGVGDG